MASSQPVTVHYTMKGTANNGTDYTLSGTPGQVTIPANATSATVTLQSVSDDSEEGTETAKMVLQAGSGYTLSANDTAKVNISGTTD